MAPAEVRSFAIQLAKRLGAHVTGVDNVAKQDFMRYLGADDSIDYRRIDFTATIQPYDLILDLVAHRSVSAYRRALAPWDVPLRRWIGALAARTRGGRGGRAVQRPLHRGARRQGGPGAFEPLADLCVAGDVSIHIDRTFALDEVPAALARVGEGLAPSAKLLSTCPELGWAILGLNQ